jgi:heme-degrading monooxygenase HmoA
MHARVTRLKGDPAQVDEATESYRDVLGRFAEIDGNRGSFLFVDREAGVALGITLWDDAEAMTAARDRASQLRQQAADQVSAQIDAVEEFEVAMWEVQS